MPHRVHARLSLDADGTVRAARQIEALSAQNAVVAERARAASAGFSSLAAALRNAWQAHRRSLLALPYRQFRKQRRA